MRDRLLICEKCKGSLSSYVRNGERIFRCVVCGHETTSPPKHVKPRTDSSEQLPSRRRLQEFRAKQEEAAKVEDGDNNGEEPDEGENEDE